MDPLKMIGPGVSMEALALQRAQNAETAAQGQGGTPGKTKEAAIQFESMLLQQMLQSMWNTVPKDSLLGGSQEEATYRDMYTEALAQEIAQNQGLGVRDVVLKELEKKGGPS